MPVNDRDAAQPRELTLRDLHALLDWCASGKPLGERDRRVAVGSGQLVEMLFRFIELALDPLGVGISPAAVHRGGEFGGVETMEYGLDDEQLELVGLDEDAAASREADTASAPITALASVVGTRYEPRTAQAAAQESPVGAACKAPDMAGPPRRISGGICCLCGAHIDLSDPEYTKLAARWTEAGDERAQWWSAHRRCLAERMHERVGGEGPFFDDQV